MNLIDQTVWLNVAYRVGWTLVHSLWQLAVVAALVIPVLYLLRRATSQSRYVVACSGLVLMAMLPIVTFVFVPAPRSLALPSRASNSQHDANHTSPEIRSRRRQTLDMASDGAHDASVPERVLTGDTSFDFASVQKRRSDTHVGVGDGQKRAPYDAPKHKPVVGVGRNAAASTTDSQAVLPIAESLETPSASPTQTKFWRIPLLDVNALQLVPWVTWIWMAGVVVFAVIHARGLYVVRRLCRVDVGEINEENPLRRRMETLADRLGIRRAIRLLQSKRVSTPMVIGWIRPVVLVPVGIMTGLSPSGLDAILAHELAHIRRHDYLVNVLQVLIETLLFYHPTVWWLSRRIRLEREYCCDDEAAAVCGSNLDFAKALVALEGARTGTTLALAASGPGKEKTTIKRIRRLLEGKTQDVAAGSGALAVMLAVLLFAGVAVCFAMAGDDNVGQVSQPAEHESSRHAEKPAASAVPLTQSDAQNEPAGSLATFASKKSLPEGLVFWNTFDSKQDIYKSRVGPGGIYRAEGGEFIEGVAGSALQLNHDDYEAVAFPKEVVPHKAGCIEFWAKLTDLPRSLPDGQRPALIQIHDGRSAFGLHLNGNDGYGSGGLCGWAGRMGHCGTGAAGNWSYERVLGEGQANQWHHYALVWDHNGLKSIGDGTRQFAVYLDGKLNTESWRDGGRSKFQPLKGGKLTLLVKHTPIGQGSIAFDELKIWDYAKTEFEEVRLADSREVQLSEGLVGHWTLDGHTRDSSGRGHHGSDWSHFTTDRFDDAKQAFEGNGRTGFVTIPDHEDLDTHDAFTLSAWINPRNYVDEDGLRGLIVGKWHSGSTIRYANGEYTLKVNEEGRLQVVVGNYDADQRDERGWDDLSSETIIPKNKWTHVAATFQKGKLTLYVGGRRDLTKQSRITSTTDEEYVHDDIRIGGLWNGHYIFDGGIDDVRIYSRALSDEEVVALHKAVPHRFALYDASRGTLPTEHGFRLYDNNLDSAPPRVEKGVLLQGPTSTKGEQRWQSKRIPLDFRAEASAAGLSAEWIVRVVQTELDQERQYTGWHAHFIDQHGHFFLIALAADQIVLHAFPDPKPAVAKFDTTDAFHHYRFVVDDNQGILLVDGKPLLSKSLGKPDAPKIKANRVLFGDATSSAGAQTELKAFYYSNDPRAKSPFHPARPRTTEQLRKSLILHYTFDRQWEDGMEPDESDHGNNAKIHGATWQKDGAIGGAIEFDGEDDFLDCGNDKSVNFGDGGFTVALWFNTPLTDKLPHPYSYNPFVYKGNAGSHRPVRPGYGLYATTEHGKAVLRWDFGQRGPEARARVITDEWEANRWNHVVLVRRGKAIEAWLNGARVTKEVQKATSEASVSGPEHLFVGKNVHNRNLPCFYQGLLDDIRIYNCALSEQQIGSLVSMAQSSDQLQNSSTNDDSPVRTQPGAATPTELRDRIRAAFARRDVKQFVAELYPAELTDLQRTDAGYYVGLTMFRMELRDMFRRGEKRFGKDTVTEIKTAFGAMLDMQHVVEQLERMLTESVPRIRGDCADLNTDKYGDEFTWLIIGAFGNFKQIDGRWYLAGPVGPDPDERPEMKQALATCNSFVAQAKQITQISKSPDEFKEKMIERIRQFRERSSESEKVPIDVEPAEASGTLVPRPIPHDTFDSRDEVLKSKIGPPGAYKGGESEQDIGIRASAIRVLGELGDHRATELILRFLEDPNRNVRESAAGTLAELGAKRAIPALRKILQREGGLRELSVLTHLGDKQANCTPTRKLDALTWHDDADDELTINLVLSRAGRLSLVTDTNDAGKPIGFDKLGELCKTVGDESGVVIFEVKLPARADAFLKTIKCVGPAREIAEVPMGLNPV